MLSRLVSPMPSFLAPPSLPFLALYLRPSIPLRPARTARASASCVFLSLGATLSRSPPLTFPFPLVLGRRSNPLDVSERLALFYQPSGLDRARRDWPFAGTILRERTGSISPDFDDDDDEGSDDDDDDKEDDDDGGRRRTRRQTGKPMRALRSAVTRDTRARFSSLPRRTWINRGGGRVRRAGRDCQTRHRLRRLRRYEWRRSGIWYPA